MLEHRWTTRVVLLGVACLGACARGDIGAPCNHGPGQVPQEPVITFPALACEQLLCVFAESIEPPVDPCERDEDCNGDGSDRFACAEGRCVLENSYVIGRSMCSAECSADDDCEVEGDTACQSGFACTPLMRLGEQCCQKVCVCRDELSLAATEELEQQCAVGDVPGCCDREPRPEGCGP